MRYAAALAGIVAAVAAPACVIAAPAASDTPVQVRIVDQWVTPATLPYDFQVAHVRVRIAAHVPVDVRVVNFTATLMSDGGGTDVLNALDWPSPEYENGELIGIAPPRPDVDPAEDFGAIGTLHLADGAQAVTTVSFEVPFAVTAKKPIQGVAYLAAAR